MTTFNEVKDQVFPKLNQFLPIVERVHGPHHKEIYEVGALYVRLRDKVNSGDNEIQEEFNELQKVTDHYKVPSDVCESYEAVYQMLEALDHAYTEK